MSSSSSIKSDDFDDEKSQKSEVKLFAGLRRLIQTQIVGPMEKGVQAARIQTPSPHTVDGVDLSVLPKFICYRAALLRERVSLQYALALVTGASLVLFVTSRIEISRLQTQLRTKEYILAPGVQDFISVSPKDVPDSHIQNAAMEFLQTLGNFNPQNIDESYGRLAESMSPELKIQFEMESAPWKAKVKEEGIAQLMTISEKEIRSDGEGHYQVTAIVKKDTFVNSEHIGSLDQVIEMVLKLVPPKDGKRWFLQIEKLQTQDANAFRVKSNFSTFPKAPVGTIQPAPGESKKLVQPSGSEGSSR